METLALLNDPVDRERLAEAELSVERGQVTSDDEMATLLAQRGQRETNIA